MNPEDPKFAAGTIVNQPRRFRHSSYNSETNYVAVYVFKNGSSPQERRNLDIHIFVFQFS